MFNDIVLVHRRDGDGFRAESAEWRLWQTCLRKIAVGPTSALSDLELQPCDQIHRGEDAYRVCLEIVCGLHSPLVGETEVFGQFKNAVDMWLGADSAFSRDLRRFTQGLIEDAKRIRAAHLSDLGSQSYGSLLRRELRGVSEVHILGAGHLVGEILPWICKDGTRVHVYARNLERAEKLAAQFPEAVFSEIKPDLKLSGALVIAAPMTARALDVWSTNTSFDRVFDLRGESATDPLTQVFSRAQVAGLDELMRRISANQEMIASRRKLALDAIVKTVAERSRHVEYRPFGWEDVCA